MKSQDRGILSRYDFGSTLTKIVYGVMLIVITAMVFSMLYPILSTLLNALKPNQEVNSFPPHFLPQGEWQWGNFAKAWDYIPLATYMKNTLWIFGGNMIATVLVLGLAAYSFAHLELPYKKGLTTLFMVTLFIPPTTYIIPNFVNLKDLGLLDSFWAFWLPAGANAFFLLLLMTFFRGIHRELLEAARMDGASELRCYFRIVFPLSVPIFSTLAIFVFAAAWNDWFWPSLVMHSQDKFPLATAVYKFVIEVRRLDTNIKFTILTMVSLPPVIVFLLFQKYIIRGVQLTGVKQ